ncbi:histone deacetylase 6 isoform X1 [Cimex lectularius]|uniref:Protein deacetylase HDAC6 n=1 Tax=Cimex lectularius TaxID=79782 RepID=A0A8I6SAB5_CIMLE|nr:histone deacetylase 6 isoform X1 [Cimex lectularius]
MESYAKKNIKKTTDGPLRRSTRLQSQGKPNPNLVAAKKNAQLKMGNSKKQPIFSFVADIYQVARESKEHVYSGTGLVFDNKMIEHKCLWDENYPECPDRLTSIIHRCKELGLVNRCQIIESSKASDADILTLHSSKQIALLKSTQNCNDINHLENISANFDSIFIHPSTYECSLIAAGSAVKLIDSICNKNVQNGMALIRPPGHHAMVNDYCGYCFFNNAALAAKHALNQGLQRILIVDWDVHHGQGTQQMFYEDPRVVYFSIHRYEYGLFWPNLRESDFDHIGSGPGRGFNFNIPLNSTGMTDADYLAIFHQLLLRIAYEYQPELVIVSAGYDAALGCPEGEMELSPAVYAHLITSLMGLAGGKVAVILEGGYCIRSLSESAALTLRALLGDPCPKLPSVGSPCENIQETILNVIYIHRDYWKCFRYHNVCSIHEPPGEEEERHLPVVRYEYDEPKPEKYQTRNCYPIQTQEFIKSVNLKLDDIILKCPLLRPEHRVCLVYDTKMMEHKNYEDRDHIEKPARISSIYKMHEEYSLLQRVHMIKGRSATDEELLYAHSKDHILEMKELAYMTGEQLVKKKEIYHSVYFHQYTYKAACLAAGCLLEVVDNVLRGESATGVAIIRPPGHHADIDDPCGFCIFNNVAIAAHHAIKKYGLKRVLIVDWDVHHGNGTQEIFLEDSNVMYMSIHRFDNGEFFPHTGDGAAIQIGRGEGLGYTVNIPWNKSKMGDGDYCAAFFQVILPIAYQFEPELVLVSAGFDAAVGDPLGGCKVTPEAFGHMTSWLLPLANGRIILSLEGGYNINSISYAMTMCTKALLGDPLPSLKEGLSPCESAIESINETIIAHSPYWPAIKFNKFLPVEHVLTQTKKLKTPQTKGSSKNMTQTNCEVQLMRGLTLSEEKLTDGNEDENKSKEGSGGVPPQESTASASNSNRDPNRSQTITEFFCDNIQALVNEEMYAIVPLKTCPHLPQINDIPDQGLDHTAPCISCRDTNENWVCLTCYTVQCGRYINEHMLYHNLNSEHPLALSYSDLSVWCYPCQAYIDNQLLYQAKNAAHISKFGTKLAWSYRKD